MGRLIRGTGRVVTTLVFEPDRWSRQQASIAAVTNTFSPASALPSTRYTGLSGYGVNRSSAYPRESPQAFKGASTLNSQQGARLGMGAGVSGQPGLPSTGSLAGIGWLGWAGPGVASGV